MCSSQRLNRVPRFEMAINAQQLKSLANVRASNFNEQLHQSNTDSVQFKHGDVNTAQVHSTMLTTTIIQCTSIPYQSFKIIMKGVGAIQY